MFVNLAVVALAALLMAKAFEKIRLPGLLGMILTGVILGPYVLNYISPEALKFSKELRTLALIVILIRAGLGINRKTLNKVGGPALRMSFIPGILEGSAILLMAKFFMDFSWAESGMLGFIVAAVSPAVVVPQMLNLKSMGLGRHREVPTLILAGASLDDVFAITIFGAFLSFGLGKGNEIAMMLAKIPVSILLGVLIGLILGFILEWVFKNFTLRATQKMLIFMTASLLFHELEKAIPVASLLGIMAMGFLLLERDENQAHQLAEKFNKVWVLAELLLFLLIGAAVNIKVAFNSGLVGLGLISIGLLVRSGGVWLALLKSQLNKKERFFSMIAYIPKATVQAAIGAIPLSYGIGAGESILAIAVLSIVFTAPLGAIGIQWSAHKLLEK